VCKSQLGWLNLLHLAILPPLQWLPNIKC